MEQGQTCHSNFRFTDLEKDVAILKHNHDALGKSLEAVAKSIHEMAAEMREQNKRHIETDKINALLVEQLKTIDSKATAAHTRIDEIEKTNKDDKKKIFWLIATPVIAALLSMVIGVDISLKG